MGSRTITATLERSKGCRRRRSCGTLLQLPSFLFRRSDSGEQRIVLCPCTCALLAQPRLGIAAEPLQRSVQLRKLSRRRGELAVDLELALAFGSLHGIETSCQPLDDEFLRQRFATLLVECLAHSLLAC